MSNTFTAAEVSDVQDVEAAPVAPMPEARVAKRSRTRRPSASGKTSRSKKARNTAAPTTKQELVLQMLAGIAFPASTSRSVDYEGAKNARPPRQRPWSRGKRRPQP